MVMHPPQIVARQLIGRGGLEARHFHPERVDALKHVADGGILAGRVHCLQHDQKLVPALGVQQLLQGFQARTVFIQALARIRFVLADDVGLVGIPLRQLDLGIGGNTGVSRFHSASFGGIRVIQSPSAWRISSSVR